jgi:FdhE protein
MACLEQRLAVLSAGYPELAGDLASEASLLRAVLQDPRTPRTPLPPLPRERLVARLGAGIPVLHEEPLFIDVGFALNLLDRLVRSTREAGCQGTDSRAESIREALMGARLDAEQVFAEAFVQHPDHLAQLAVAGGASARTLARLAERTVAPLRHGYARGLEPVLKTTDSWREGYCPVCGSWPVMADAETHAASGGFRCAACGTGWRLADRRCPFCGTNDSRHLAVVELERTTGPLLGVQLCDACGRYLKLAEPLDGIPSALLAFEDLGSRSLDHAALARGFERPSVSGFTLELGLPEPGWSDALAAIDTD